MAASFNPMECGVCQEMFDEETRSPRNLPCSHHFCSLCVGVLIRSNSKTCPFCRKAFTAGSPEELMKNNGLLECISYMANVTKESSKVKRHSYQNKLEELKSEVSMSNDELLDTLDKLKRRLEKLAGDVSRLKANIASENANISGSITPMINAILADNEKSIDELKKAGNTAEYELKGLKIDKLRLKSLNTRLQETKTFTEAAKLMDEAVETSTDVDESIKQLKITLSEVEDTVRNKTKEVRVLEEKVRVMAEILTNENPDTDLIFL